MTIAQAIAHTAARKNLSADEMAEVTGQIMDGQATPAQIGALLLALRMKGEVVDEVVGAARAMRARALPFSTFGVVVDTCGTGGDGRGTLNISTIAALVVAAAGVKVAKHGNRASSSRSGSADLLEALGVKISPPKVIVERCLAEANIGFLFAPDFHQATRHAAAPRREIGVRTVFNLLGPLTNPANVRHQVVGVYSDAVLTLVAETLGALGSERALVVHGNGGLDEFAPAGHTKVAELRDGKVNSYAMAPRDFGLDEVDAAGLNGGDATENAARTRAILAGEKGAARNCVIMTAAAALYVTGAGTLIDSARRAEALLDDGSAKRVLERLVTLSNAEART